MVSMALLALALYYLLFGDVSNNLGINSINLTPQTNYSSLKKSIHKGDLFSHQNIFHDELTEVRIDLQPEFLNSMNAAPSFMVWQ